MEKTLVPVKARTMVFQNYYFREVFLDLEAIVSCYELSISLTSVFFQTFAIQNSLGKPRQLNQHASVSLSGEN